MNVAIVGLFSFDLISVAGGVLLLLGHGIVSPALFISIGVLYDRLKTRLCRYYSGMALSMPLFSTMLFVFTLANLSLPSTVNFIGEFLVFQGTFDQNPFAAAVIATSLVSVGAYALFVCARATFGVPKPAAVSGCDLSRREFFICLPFRPGEPYRREYLLPTEVGRRGETWNSPSSLKTVDLQTSLLLRCQRETAIMGRSVLQVVSARYCCCKVRPGRAQLWQPPYYERPL